MSVQSIVSNLHHYARTDNFATALTFADGSVAVLTNTAMGSSDYHKEAADLYVDGRLVVLDH